MVAKRQLTPDTLNLQDHARLALNHLTRCLDDNMGYLPYFWVFLDSDPAEASHGLSWEFGDISGRYLDAMILARQMTGSQIGEKEERALKELLYSCLDKEDGLSYSRESPWSRHEADMFSQRSPMIALLDLYMLNEEPDARRSLDKLVKGLLRVAVHSNDYCYYPNETYTKNGWDVDSGYGEPAWYGVQILPLVRFYEVTGSRDALVLAKKLVNNVVYHCDAFADDGSFSGHTHSRMGTTAGVLRFGMATNKREYIEWAKRVYEWAKAQGTEFGWFPEVVEPGRDCETCAIVDMIDCAIMLAKAGYHKYWGDVERYARNQLVENQLRDVSWIRSVKGKREGEFIGPFNITLGGKTYTHVKADIPSRLTDNVLERVKGGFAGWSAPNDWVGNVPLTKYKMMNCCSGAGVRGLFLVWHNIVTTTPEGVFVNLSMTRDTKWVKIKSYRPYEGRLEIDVHSAPKVFVRVPEWAQRSDVRVLVNGTGRTVRWVGDYVKVSRLKHGDSVALTYPMRSRKTREIIIGGVKYVTEWKGDTVIRISPPGEEYPLYQREGMLSDKTPMREIELYKPEKEIDW